MSSPFVCSACTAAVYQWLNWYDQLRSLIEVTNWELFGLQLEWLWRPRRRKSPAGRKPRDAVLIFKRLILSVLYELPDAETELQVDDRYTFPRFLGLDETAPVPDEKTLWDYRNRLRVTGTTQTLLNNLDTYLESLRCPPPRP